MDYVKIIDDREKQLLLKMYDSQLEDSPEKCLYMYGRNTFGFIDGIIKYQVDGFTLKTSKIR